VFILAAQLQCSSVIRDGFQRVRLSVQQFVTDIRVFELQSTRMNTVVWFFLFTAQLVFVAHARVARDQDLSKFWSDEVTLSRHLCLIARWARIKRAKLAVKMSRKLARLNEPAV
jgi:hypothetical protein